MKLNLGCGKDYREDCINCDISNSVQKDLNLDFNKKFPLKDNLVSGVLAKHVLEHALSLEFTLSEIYRVCKNKARIYISVPYFSHESAFSNYQHKNYFTWTTFDLFNPNHNEHFHTDLKFKVIKKELRGRFKGNKVLVNFFPRLYQEYLCWIIPVKEIYYELEVIK